MSGRLSRPDTAEAQLGVVVFALTLGLTSGALAVLHGLAPAPPRVLELAMLVAASGCATVTRYVALRTWVFAHGGPPPAARPPLRMLDNSADSQ